MRRLRTREFNANLGNDIGSMAPKFGKELEVPGVFWEG